MKSLVVKRWMLFLLSFLVAVAARSSPRLIPFDPTLEVAVHEYDQGTTNREANNVFAIFPRHQVPQIRHIRQPGALLMAVNIRELDLLPGDRLVVRDASNDTVLAVTASNQSISKRSLRRPRRVLWNHPLLMVGNRVTIEYWPSLRTLVLPINRPQLDNPVLVIESYTFAFSPRRPTIARNNGNSDSDVGKDETKVLESIVGRKNEMKPAVCYKRSKPEWYNKSRSVARLIIQRSTNASTDSPTRFAAADGAVGSDDSRDTPSPTDPPSRDVSWTFCTGWLLGRGNHMITNYHCFYELTRVARSATPTGQSTSARFRKYTTRNSSIPSPSPIKRNTTTTTKPLKEVNVNFMAEASTCNATGRLGERVGEINATSVEILVANEALDYCLLKLLPNGSSASADLAKTFGYLTMRERGPVDGEPIFVPQHANGEPKIIASTKDGKAAVIRVPSYNRTRSRVGGDTVGDRDNVSVRYDADTAPGSSGSPVISQRDNTVVALHHAGTGMRPGQITTGWFSRFVDFMRGSDGSDDDSAISEDEWNVGIRIDAIVADLRKRRLLPPCAVAQKCGGSANSTRLQSSKTKAGSCCDATW